MTPAAAKSFAGLLLFLAGGAGIGGFILLRQSAPLFESIAAVRVVRDKTDLEQLPANAPAGLGTAVFLQNEAEVIGSDPVLQKVIARLELNQEWGKRLNGGAALASAETVARLKSRLQISPAPGTALLRIRVAGDDGPEATKLADAFATAYCEYRVERRRRLAQTTIDTLAAAYAENEARVRRAGELVEQMRRELDSVTSAAKDAPADARGELSRLTMIHLTQSNQLARSRELPAAELQKLEAQVTRIYTALTNAEAAAQLDTRKKQASQAYENARQELEAARQFFAPIQEAVAEKQRDLGPLENLPALIVEAASPALPLPAHKAAAAQACLLGAGGLFVASVGLFFLPRKPVPKV